MAKKSKIARNERRKAVVARYATRRARLKEVLRRPSSTGAERAAVLAELRRQPRDASAPRRRGRRTRRDPAGRRRPRGSG
ncbi:30S ribosomal protein S14, partial [Streptomyces sp. NPDC040724]|uniref:30S ribosomal protein S14 n=1 Tax=Streptomyces sp. NPDC040724 TaxID=3155612 RepID=UPI003411BB89